MSKRRSLTLIAVACLYSVALLAAPVPVRIAADGQTHVSDVTDLPTQKAELHRSLLARESAKGLANPLEVKLTPEEKCLRFRGLGACGGAAAVEALTADVRNPNPTVRLGVALGLARIAAPAAGDGAAPADPGAVALLVDVLRDADPRVVEVAAEALGKAKSATVVTIAAAVAKRDISFPPRSANQPSSRGPTTYPKSAIMRREPMVMAFMPGGAARMTSRSAITAVGAGQVNVCLEPR